MVIMLVFTVGLFAGFLFMCFAHWLQKCEAEHQRTMAEHYMAELAEARRELISGGEGRTA